MTRKLIESFDGEVRMKTKELCMTHYRLRPTLMGNLIRMIKKECNVKVEATLQHLARQPGVLAGSDALNPMTRFAPLGFLQAMWMNEKAYAERFGCEIDLLCVRQPDGCPACMLARMGSEGGVLVALRASMLVWMSARRAAESKRLEWVENWMRGFSESEFNEMIKESTALAKWVVNTLDAANHLKSFEQIKVGDYEVRGVMGLLMRKVLREKQAEKEKRNSTADRRFGSRIDREPLRLAVDPIEGPNVMDRRSTGYGASTAPSYASINTELHSSNLAYQADRRVGSTLDGSNTVGSGYGTTGATGSGLATQGPNRHANERTAAADVSGPGVDVRSTLTGPNVDARSILTGPSTVFLDHDSGTGEFHVRHRGKSELRPLSQYTMTSQAPQMTAGDKNDEAPLLERRGVSYQAPHATDDEAGYVPPREAWWKTEKPWNSEQQDTGYYEAPSPLTMRRTPSLESDGSSTLSGYSGPMSDMLSPKLPTDPLGKGMETANERTACSRAESYREIIGSPRRSTFFSPVTESKKSLIPPHLFTVAEGVYRRNQEADYSPSSPRGMEYTPWPPSWF